MGCYKPLHGYRDFKNGFTMSRKDAYVDRPMSVPCGQCIGCRLERSRIWAIRCIHEAAMHSENCFITLTYDDEHLPFGGTLQRSDFVKFIKRLRKKLPSNKIRLFYCGEYGDDKQTRRPHYHAILFGWTPNDEVLFSSEASSELFTSAFLTSTWGLGHTTHGRCTFEACAYCARYITKKITGDLAEDHYQVTDPDTGEIYNLAPEFSGQSRGSNNKQGGLGSAWLRKYGVDTYKKDQIIINGKAMKPPRFYDNFMEKNHPELWKTVRARRALKFSENIIAKITVPSTGEAPTKEQIRKGRVTLQKGAWNQKDPTKSPQRRLMDGEKIAKARLQQRKSI